MSRDKAFALSGALFAVIATTVTVRGEWLPGLFMFAAAIACALRANAEWKRNNA